VVGPPARPASGVTVSPGRGVPAAGSLVCHGRHHHGPVHHSVRRVPALRPACPGAPVPRRVARRRGTQVDHQDRRGRGCPRSGAGPAPLRQQRSLGMEPSAQEPHSLPGGHDPRPCMDHRAGFHPQGRQAQRRNRETLPPRRTPRGGRTAGLRAVAGLRAHGNARQLASASARPAAGRPRRRRRGRRRAAGRGQIVGALLSSGSGRRTGVGTGRPVGLAPPARGVTAGDAGQWTRPRSPPPSGAGR
jgi:hypothetical protein